MNNDTFMKEKPIFSLVLMIGCMHGDAILS